MEGPLENPAEEIKRLRSCINDLVSFLAIPAMWSGGEPSQVVHSLLDTLLRMLQLDFVYVRLKDSVGETPVEMVRIGESQNLMSRSQEICQALHRWLEDDPQKSPRAVRKTIGGEDISIVPFPLGLHGEIGVIVGGIPKGGFPRSRPRDSF